jgi:membrane peptidoglycan carboxypeptidase
MDPGPDSEICVSATIGNERRAAVCARAVTISIAGAAASVRNAAAGALAALRRRFVRRAPDAHGQLAVAESSSAVADLDASSAEAVVAGEKNGSSALPRNARIGRAEFLVLLLGGGLIVLMLNQPLLESVFVWRAVADLTFNVEPGASPAMRFPQSGPYDQRLGYVELPSLIRRLEDRDFEIVMQARQSPALQGFIEAGGYAVYHEKSQAGLVLKDHLGLPLDAAPYPSAAYQQFGEIPALIVDTLRFIEDRDLLDPRHPYRNPAVEWRRFALAAAGRLGGVIDPDFKRGGASTLATQIEKYRHSPAGRTGDTTEKVRQMATATARAYLDGPQTISTQREIITTYLDSTPLGSRPGYGEVIGLGDAMLAWYGVDFAEANRLLSGPVASGAQVARRAQVYKEALSLLIAQRRPSYYLNAGRKDLEHLANAYLRALAGAAVIDPVLRDTALKLPLAFTNQSPTPVAGSFVERKAVAAARNELVGALGLSDVYRLDRMDVSADVSFDAAVQSRVANLLERLKDPRELKALGLVGDQLLGDADPSKVAWSVVLYERAKDRNLVRIHADSLEKPFDINSGAKLILGSTAKLRTLATYLGVIEGLYHELAISPSAALRKTAATSADPLRRWAAGYLAGLAPQQRTLERTLDAAMQRTYSASPYEEFFTGGGVHVFHNFERFEDRMRPTVEQAFEHSINLAFVRLLRDVIRHYEADFGARDEVLSSADNPLRALLLRRFADQEGSVFLARFAADYAGLSPGEALEHLAGTVRPATRRLVVMFRTVRPDGTPAQMRSFLQRHMRDVPDEAAAAQLYARYDPERFSVSDRGFLVGVHPLELWLVAYLQRHPYASRPQVLAASADERQQAYDWLFKTANVRQQDERIRGLIEEDAFDRLLLDWKRQGYPFGRLVPSLATAIGSSGDRPNALATLMGIILNDGVKQSTTDLERVRFAADTPYDTELAYRPDRPERVMSAQVAAILRRALGGVVGSGTATRVRGVYLGSDGAALPIGGKTGTGDNRFESFGPGHQLIEDRPVDRTATFVFFLGDRLYGSVTAYVAGAQAGNYHFTSALAVSLLKVLAPELRPLLQSPGQSSPAAPRIVAQATPNDRLADTQAKPRL